MTSFFLSKDTLIEAVEIAARQMPLALWETFYATVISTVFAIVLGLPLGVLLVVGEKDNIAPIPKWIMSFLNTLINILRSVPFLILIVVVMPVTRLIMGTTIGMPAAIVPLVIAAFPYVARLVEGSIREVDPNVVEMALSMGATTMQIIRKVLLVEAVPSLIHNFTLALTTILGYTAMSAAFGGGGLGQMAINYGYYRYKYWIMIIAVVAIVVLVQLFQSIGTYLAVKSDKRMKH